MVLEHVEGGELFDYLVKKGKLDTSEAMTFFQQIISGIEYCHNHMICHRDLKPENLLLDADKNIKVGDFGMASFMKKGSLLQTSCGSPHYASPEVVMGYKYDGKAADVWSSGVILFALLTGKLPFDDDNIRRLLSKVKSGVFSMPQFLHKDIKDLLWKMLTVDPTKRITIAEIKEHPWYKSHINNSLPTPCLPIEIQTVECIQDEELDDEIVRSLQALGMGNEDEIKTTLTSVDGYSVAQSFYRILLHRKLNPPAEMLPTPKLRSPLTRNRTNSAPAPYVPPMPVNPNSTTTTTTTTTGIPTSANNSNITIGLTNSNSNNNSNNNLSSNNSGRESPTMLSGRDSPTAIGSPSTSPTMGSKSPSQSPINTPPLSPLLSKQLTIQKRRNSSASPPVSIMPNTRFQKMRLESLQQTSGSPIIGSSPKRSWFSSFFSKTDKDSKDDINNNNNNNIPGANNSNDINKIPTEPFGVATTKDITEINSEIQRSIKALNITLTDVVNSQLYSLSYQARVPNVKLNLEILNINTGELNNNNKDSLSNGYFVNFVQQSGNLEDCIFFLKLFFFIYTKFFDSIFLIDNELCEKLQLELRL